MTTPYRFGYATDKGLYWTDDAPDVVRAAGYWAGLRNWNSSTPESAANLPTKARLAYDRMGEYQPE
jgi:hypothetical protein